MPAASLSRCSPRWPSPPRCRLPHSPRAEAPHRGDRPRRPPGAPRPAARPWGARRPSARGPRAARASASSRGRTLASAAAPWRGSGRWPAAAPCSAGARSRVAGSGAWPLGDSRPAGGRTGGIPPPSSTCTGPTAPTRAGRFPVAGPHTILGGGGRFGADRGDHIHQGQDIPAAEGAPVVAPVRGTVIWRSYQRGGAGYYLVLHAADARDYVFMHLRKGSIEVVAGDRVGAGRRLAEVGQTGHAEGPHLHFEVWVGGWRAEGGRAIDPLPSLKAWGG